MTAPTDTAALAAKLAEARRLAAVWRQLVAENRVERLSDTYRYFAERADERVTELERRLAGRED
jgi:hypothetical protein